ncbi:hypothetical protein SLA2020_495310 [Shorea laevis]
MRPEPTLISPASPSRPEAGPPARTTSPPRRTPFGPSRTRAAPYTIFSLSRSFDRCRPAFWSYSFARSSSGG